MNYLPRLALNHDPPGLCLLSSWDYRREPQCLANFFLHTTLPSTFDVSTVVLCECFSTNSHPLGDAGDGVVTDTWLSNWPRSQLNRDT
jgi:hypothetical protein